MSSRIEEAAAAERAAEQTRKQAEATWRAAWWETTLALAEPDRKGEVSRVLDEAAVILGQSRGYLLSRRETGRDFVDLEVDEIKMLPPRLAIAWSKEHGKPIDAEAAGMLRQADQDGTSLREFIANLGAVPPSTGAERFERPKPTVEQVREAMADPVVRREVMADPDTRQAASDAITEQYTARSTSDPRNALADSEGEQRREQSEREAAMFDLRDSLNRAAGLMRLALRQAIDLSLEDGERRFVQPAAQEVIEQGGNWQAFITGQSVDAFLASLSEGEA